ncbi:MAG: RNA methyltransferase [Gammaproteobacteria bacterium]|nr:RNA methyltransferase [Gammaproteobacteria bacterium]
MFQNVRIVMVNTSHPGNIGAAARALKTMGLSRLYLVAPEQYPCMEATWRAAGAADVLADAVVVDSLEEAIDGCALVLGASARQRRIPWPVIDSREGGVAIALQAQTEQVAVVFGREDRGLSNDELQLCNYHIEIPANEEYGVLNVASAIQVVCYEIRCALLASADMQSKNQAIEMPVKLVRWDERLATSKELAYFFEHMQKTLESLDFYEPNNPRQLMTRLRRLFMRSQVDHLELNILRGVMTAIQKKLSK